MCSGHSLLVITDTRKRKCSWAGHSIGSGSVARRLPDPRISEPPYPAADWAILSSKSSCMHIIASRPGLPFAVAPAPARQDKEDSASMVPSLVETTLACAAGVLGFFLSLFCSGPLFHLNPSQPGFLFGSARQGSGGHQKQLIPRLDVRRPPPLPFFSL